MVAPYVGAWIETVKHTRCLRYGLSHPTWVRGLKPRKPRRFVSESCRTLRGCVD